MMSEAQYVFLAVARAATIAEGRTAGNARIKRHVYETVIARARMDDRLACAARAELHAANVFYRARTAAAVAHVAERDASIMDRDAASASNDATSTAHDAHLVAHAADVALKGALARLKDASATVERATQRHVLK